MERIIQIAPYTFRFCSSLTHIKSDDWALYPFLLQFHDFQALKEFLSALQIHLQSIDEN